MGSWKMKEISDRRNRAHSSLAASSRLMRLPSRQVNQAAPFGVSAGSSKPATAKQVSVLPDPD